MSAEFDFTFVPSDRCDPLERCDVLKLVYNDSTFRIQGRHTGSGLMNNNIEGEGDGSGTSYEFQDI